MNPNGQNDLPHNSGIVTWANTQNRAVAALKHESKLDPKRFEPIIKLWGDFYRISNALLSIEGARVTPKDFNPALLSPTYTEEVTTLDLNTTWSIWEVQYYLIPMVKEIWSSIGGTNFRPNQSNYTETATQITKLILPHQAIINELNERIVCVMKIFDLNIDEPKVFGKSLLLMSQKLMPIINEEFRNSKEGLSKVVGLVFEVGNRYEEFTQKNSFYRLVPGLIEGLNRRLKRVLKSIEVYESGKILLPTSGSKFKLLSPLSISDCVGFYYYLGNTYPTADEFLDGLVNAIGKDGLSVDNINYNTLFARCMINMGCMKEFIDIIRLMSVQKLPLLYMEDRLSVSQKTVKEYRAICEEEAGQMPFRVRSILLGYNTNK